MKKWLVGILGVIFLVFTMRYALAALEIQKINADFANKDALIWLQTGNFIQTNSVSANGDTVETTSFMPIGEATSVEVKDPAFTQIFGGLIQSQAVNIDAITNATIGIVGTSIAGEDTTTTDLGNQWFYQQLAILLSQGVNWDAIKQQLSGINWAEITAINGTAGTNWTALQASGINWSNFPNCQGKGVNWSGFIKNNGQC